MDILKSGAIFKLSADAIKSPASLRKRTPQKGKSNEITKDASSATLLKAEFDMVARATPVPSWLSLDSTSDTGSRGQSNWNSSASTSMSVASLKANRMNSLISNQFDTVARRTPMPPQLNNGRSESMVVANPIPRGGLNSGIDINANVYHFAQPYGIHNPKPRPVHHFQSSYGYGESSYHSYPVGTHVAPAVHGSVPTSVPEPAPYNYSETVRNVVSNAKVISPPALSNPLSQTPPTESPATGFPDESAEKTDVALSTADSKDAVELETQAKGSRRGRNSRRNTSVVAKDANSLDTSSDGIIGSTQQSGRSPSGNTASSFEGVEVATPQQVTKSRSTSGGGMRRGRNSFVDSSSEKDSSNRQKRRRVATSESAEFQDPVVSVLAGMGKPIQLVPTQNNALKADGSMMSSRRMNRLYNNASQNSLLMLPSSPHMKASVKSPGRTNNKPNNIASSDKVADRAKSNKKPVTSKRSSPQAAPKLTTQSALAKHTESITTAPSRSLSVSNRKNQTKKSKEVAGGRVVDTPKKTPKKTNKAALQISSSPNPNSPQASRTSSRIQQKRIDEELIAEALQENEVQQGDLSSTNMSPSPSSPAPVPSTEEEKLLCLKVASPMGTVSYIRSNSDTSVNNGEGLSSVESEISLSPSKPLANAAVIRENNMKRLLSPSPVKSKMIVQHDIQAVVNNKITSTVDTDAGPAKQIENETAAVVKPQVPRKISSRNKQVELLRMAKEIVFSKERPDDLFAMTPGKGLAVPYFNKNEDEELVADREEIVDGVRVIYKRQCDIEGVKTPNMSEMAIDESDGANSHNDSNSDSDFESDNERKYKSKSSRNKNQVKNEKKELLNLNSNQDEFKITSYSHKLSEKLKQNRKNKLKEKQKNKLSDSHETNSILNYHEQKKNYKTSVEQKLKTELKKIEQLAEESVDEFDEIDED